MSAENGRLKGKAALITGAGSGIGYAVAKLFAEQGAQVAAIARRDEHLEKLQNLTKVLPIRADINRLDDIEHMVGEAESRFGKLDIVCNIAGIHDRLFPLHETSDELWDLIVDTNLKAPFRICRRVIGGMMERGSGVILNYGSIASVRGLHGPSYNAAKAGLIGLTTSIAVRYAAHGIRCNLIQSGGVRNTDMGKTVGSPNHPEGFQMFKDIVGKYPLDWTCDVQDAALPVLFLCSDESKHINGAIIPIDGGMSAC
jgi:NAD(P)-dependent dehydrogenase (short-subunit alcohol dehydrogenase family)